MEDVVRREKLKLREKVSWEAVVTAEWVTTVNQPQSSNSMRETLNSSDDRKL